MLKKERAHRSGFRYTIRNALSYEYFIAKINYLNMCERHKHMSDQEIYTEFKNLDKEFTRYSEKEESVGRLLEIRKELLARI